MTQRGLRRWLIAYLAALCGALPLAVPCWNGLLRGTIGRFVSVEAIHVLQYAGLGCLALLYGRQAKPPHRLVRVLLMVTGVGFLEELSQACVPHRFFEWSDVALNWLGGLLGMALPGTVEWMTSLLRRGGSEPHRLTEGRE